MDIEHLKQCMAYRLPLGDASAEQAVEALFAVIESHGFVVVEDSRKGLDPAWRLKDPATLERREGIPTYVGRIELAPRPVTEREREEALVQAAHEVCEVVGCYDAALEIERAVARLAAALAPYARAERDAEGGP